MTNINAAIISGGGSKGILALNQLIRQDTSYDILFGTSVGAIISVIVQINYYQSYALDRSLSKSVHFKNALLSTQKCLLLIPHSPSYLQTRIINPIVKKLGITSLYLDTTYELFGYYPLGFLSLLYYGALYDNSHLSVMLEQLLTVSRSADLQSIPDDMDLVVITQTLNLNLNLQNYIKIDKSGIYIKQEHGEYSSISIPDAAKYLQAAISIPGAFKPVKINNYYYGDGGMRDDILVSIFSSSIQEYCNKYNYQGANLDLYLLSYQSITTYPTSAFDLINNLKYIASVFPDNTEYLDVNTLFLTLIKNFSFKNKYTTSSSVIPLQNFNIYFASPGILIDLNGLNLLDTKHSDIVKYLSLDNPFEIKSYIVNNEMVSDTWDIFGD
jgi:hypothetical protein